MMPTAEALGLAQIRLDAESAGSGKLFVPAGSDSTLVGAQAGLILGVEGGADYVSDNDLVFNVKWVFKSDGLIFPALAIGAQNIGADTDTEYYAVATKSILSSKLAKVHGGVMRDLNGDTFFMYGASGTIGPVVLRADSVTGGEHEGFAVGAGVSLHNIDIIGTHYDYTNHSDENTVSVSYTFKPLH
ncbi:MAG TPA: hypothetical protein VHV83_15045 [Armatimonadota bacterium]|nr:hypothetical protein [Armatimonadota bacterium]